MLRLSCKVATPHLVCKENANYSLNVEKELEMLAEVRIDGSQFSGTKSVEVETPALKAAADDEWFELVTLEECTALYAGVFPHFAKMLDLELTKYPKKNSNSLKTRVPTGWASCYHDEEDCKAYFCLGDQGNRRKQFQTQKAQFMLSSAMSSLPTIPSDLVHVVNELNFVMKHDEERHPALFNSMQHAWRCPGLKKITLSMVDRIWAAATDTNEAATATNEEKIILFLPPLSLE